MSESLDSSMQYVLLDQFPRVILWSPARVVSAPGWLLGHMPRSSEGVTVGSGLKTSLILGSLLDSQSGHGLTAQPGVETNLSCTGHRGCPTPMTPSHFQTPLLNQMHCMLQGSTAAIHEPCFSPTTTLRSMLLVSCHGVVLGSSRCLL